MTKSLKVILTAVGALSILSGIFLAFIGADFSTYFSGIFLGVALVGSVFFYKEETKPKSE